jgi:hypothetical protein
MLPPSTALRKVSMPRSWSMGKPVGRGADSIV